jgi:hypothetical protein
MSPEPPAAPGPDNAVLERALADTRRTGEVVLASAVVAINGGLHLLSTIQLWTFVHLRGVYGLVPPAIGIFGVVFIALGSKLYGQRLWAAAAALALSAVSALGTGLWLLLTLGSGMLSPLALLLPAVSVAATVCAGLALGPCRRTAVARRAAAAAGMDIDLGG